VSQALLTLETQCWNKKIVQLYQPDKGIFISNSSALTGQAFSPIDIEMTSESQNIAYSDASCKCVYPVSRTRVL
jgi:hypothetical protein